MNDLPELLIHKLNCFILADKLLNPGSLSAEAWTQEVSEAFARNMPFISAFPEIFGNCEQLLTLCKNEPNVIKKIFADINTLTPEELLHIPGRLHESGLSASSRRKKQGSYYTPPYIIRYMIKASLEHLFETGENSSIKHLKIIDPACGGGSFLIEIFNTFSGQGLSEEEAIACIFGTDTDREAVKTAVFVLTLAVIARNKCLDPLHVKQLWEKQVRVGDALYPINRPFFFESEKKGPGGFMDWSGYFPAVFSATHPGFDIVIGNPPYVANKIIPPERKKIYQNSFSTALGQYDLSVLFFEQGMNLLKDGGVLSYITSNKFMAADYGKNLRKKILDTNQILEMVDVSTLRCFKNTAVYPVIITLRKKQSKDFGIRLFNIESWEDLNSREPIVVNQSFFRGNREYILTTRLTTPILSILQKIENAGDRIPQEKIRCGLAQTGFNKWVTAHENVSEKDLKKLYPFIQAGNIEPFYIKDTDFIDKTKIKPDKLLISQGSKLVIPGIAKEMKAAVDFSDRLMGRVYFVREHDTKYDLGYLAVLLNSCVLNFYYKVMYWPVHLEGGYLRFNGTYLANLPLYSGETSNPKKLSLIQAITRLGSIMISNKVCKSDLLELKTKAEALTFLLYDISSEDIVTIMDFLELPESVRTGCVQHYNQIREG